MSLITWIYTDMTSLDRPEMVPAPGRGSGQYITDLNQIKLLLNSYMLIVCFSRIMSDSDSDFTWVYKLFTPLAQLGKVARPVSVQ